MVWGRARDRCNRRRRPHLARSYPRGWCGPGARGYASVARQAPLGHRLSRQGRSFRGETLVNVARSIRRLGLGAFAALLAGALLVLVAPAARAVTIERVISPGGIE